MALRFLNSGYFAGRVGIGTETPGAKLDVDGDVLIKSGEFISWGTVGATSIEGSTVSNKLQFRTNSADRMIINSSGNVGIGTTTPNAKLDVQGTQGQLFSVTDDLSGEIFAVADISGVPIMTVNSSGVSYFDGNVGIGTDSPSAKLEVSEASSGSQYEALRLTNTADSGNMGSYISWKDSYATDQLQIVSQRDGAGNGSVLTFNQRISGVLSPALVLKNGNVGIGTTSPNSKLEVNGAVTFANVDTFGQLVVKASSGTTGDMLNIGVDTANSVAFIQAVERGTNVIPLSLQRYGGNVGIGTSSPGAKLEVRSDGSASGGAEIRLQHANNNTNDVVSTVNFANNAGSVGMIQAGTAGANNTGYIALFTDIAGSSSERMRVHTNGNVGIGTTSPQAGKRLDVRSDSNIAGSNAVAGYGYNDTGAGILAQGYATSGAGTNYGIRALATGPRTGGTNVGGHFSATGAANNYALTTGTGNVGIGTTSPSNKLTIASGTGGGTAPDSRTQLYIDKDGEAYISINSPADSFNGLRLSIANSPKAFMELYDNTAQGKKLNIGTVDARDLVFDTTNLEKMRITSGGNVGIGTTSPGEKLDVNGNIKIDSALLSNQENTDIDTGAEVVAQVAHATYTAAFFDFVVKKGTNVRSGTVYACHDGDTTPLVEFTETSTQDLGDTSDVVLSVDISGTQMRLLATVASDDWSVKSLIRAI